MICASKKKLKEQVGAGDVLEIGFSGALDDASTAQLETSLKEQLNGSNSQLQLDLQAHLLSVRALNIIGSLPGILEQVRQAGLQPGDVRLRENTLEDVFIQLTGRRLRE